METGAVSLRAKAVSMMPLLEALAESPTPPGRTASGAHDLSGRIRSPRSVSPWSVCELHWFGRFHRRRITQWPSAGGVSDLRAQEVRRSFRKRSLVSAPKKRLRIRDQCGSRLQFLRPIHLVFRVLPIRFRCTGAITSRRFKKRWRRIGVNEAFMGATIGFAVGITFAVSELLAAVNNITNCSSSRRGCVSVRGSRTFRDAARRVGHHAASKCSHC
jgi:hypothetical protein